MKKIFTLLAGALCSMGAMATTFDFTSEAPLSQTIDGFTVSIQKGAGSNEPAYYSNGLRLYAKNTITVTGADINNINITFSMQGLKDYATLTASTGKLISGGVSTSSTDKKTDSWLGEANSVTFTLGDKGQRLIYQLEVNGEGSVGGGGYDEEVLNFDSAEAVYESEIMEYFGVENYSVFLFNEESYDLPYFALDLYPETKDNLVGTYTWDDYTLGDYTYYMYGYGDEDITWAEDGEVTITKSGDIYSIEGTFICDDGRLYTVSFSGKMPIYLDKDYYGDGDDDGDDSAVGTIAEEEADLDAPAYDLQGRRVGKTYRGIVIRGGKKTVNNN